MLVAVDTFSGWVEAFFTRKETNEVVALIENLIPRYGVPEKIGSYNGPAFTSRVLQGFAKAMGSD